MSFGGMLTGGDEEEEKAEPVKIEAKVEVKEDLKKEEEAKEIIAENNQINK